jgi:hypothetical protein
MSTLLARVRFLTARLVYIYSIGQLITLDSFMKILKVATIFLLLFFLVKVVFYFFNGLGYILGDFWHETSGHTVRRSSPDSKRGNVNELYLCHLRFPFGPSIFRETFFRTGRNHRYLIHSHSSSLFSAAKCLCSKSNFVAEKVCE